MLVEILIIVIMIIVCFISAGNNELFRVTPPHLVDNTVTLYLGDQH